MDTLLGGISNHNIGPQLIRALQRETMQHPYHALRYFSDGTCSLWQGKILPDLADTPECKLAVLRSSDYGAVAAAPYLYKNHLSITVSGIIENIEQFNNANPVTTANSEKPLEQQIASLIDRHWQLHHDLLLAIQTTCKSLRGYYSLSVFSKENPEHIYCTTTGPSLFIAHGSDTSFFASQAKLLQERAALITELHHGDIAQLSANKVCIFDTNGAIAQRDPSPVHSAGQLPHFMVREIHAQASNSAEFILQAQESRLENWLSAPQLFANIDNILLIASGSSYHAAQTARFWLDNLAKLPTHVELASEFRHLERAITPNTLVVAISQSGETIDTVVSLQHAKLWGAQTTLAISNQANSTLMRNATLQFQMRAGEELGATSTKTFTAQLLCLFLLATTLAKARHRKLSPQLDAELRALPSAIAAVLALTPTLKEWGLYLSKKPNLLVTARQMYYPIAQEGALKLKEVAYLHAEACPSGELKHGPLALVGNNLPVIACLPWDILADQLLANLHDVRNKHGEIFALCDIALPQIAGFNSIRMPAKLPYLNPILYAVALQLLAYYTAIHRGNTIDTPRNISKTVTTE